MDKNLAKILVEKYPVIFQDYGGDPRQTCMSWGIECGDGWFDLIDQMCQDITNIIGNKNIEVIAEQVKEKFGGLRFYYSTNMSSPHSSSMMDKIRRYMFSHRHGSQYWSLVEFRKKFWRSTYEKVSDRIEQAESDSYKICETCGEPGEAKGGGWIRTSCDNCDKKFSEGKRPWEDNWDE